MGRLGRVIYITVLALFAALAIFALWLGLWLYALLALVFGVTFVYAGWYVLTGAWRPPPPTQRRRPVRRRRW
ncbi:MAG: hypothetical protein ACR2LS_00530 [Thermomicrobiales bacterium]